MPELPEVETIRRDLKVEILKKKISRLRIIAAKSVQGKVKDYDKLLTGNFFSDIKRMGKLLIFELGDKKNLLLVHLKMTGQLVYSFHGDILAGGHSEGKDDQEFAKKLPGVHTRIEATFEDGSRLFFNDLRRFGYWRIITKDDLLLVKKKFGIEPLTKDFTLNNLTLALKSKKKSKIKSALLDQKKISGIGNIYADEILFAAGVRPTRLAGSLNEQEIRKIFLATQAIIKKAIKYRGTTFNNYRDARGRKGNFTKLLKVYGRAGEPCRRCHGRVKKIKLGGRGTHYCEKCQV